MRRLLIGSVLGAIVAGIMGGGPVAIAEPTCVPAPVVVCVENQTEPNPAAGITVVDPSSGSLVLLGLSGQSTPPFATACAIVQSSTASDGGCVIVVSDGASQATIFVIRLGSEPTCTRIDLPSGEQADCG